MTLFTLGMNRLIFWNVHWFIFVETSMSNTLSTAKFIWNFPLRPERKINIKQKKFGIFFLFLICVQTSVGVPFGYNKNLGRIRRRRNVTTYDFRQVHLEPVKNAMLSSVKTFDWLLTGCMSSTSLNITPKFVFGGVFNIIKIESECTQRKLSFTDKKVD